MNSPDDPDGARRWWLGLAVVVFFLVDFARPHLLECVRIRAYNATGNSTYSNTSGARTALFSTLPSAPVMASTTIETTAIETPQKHPRTTVFSNKPIRVF